MYVSANNLKPPLQVDIETQSFDLLYNFIFKEQKNKNYVNKITAKKNVYNIFTLYN